MSEYSMLVGQRVRNLKRPQVMYTCIAEGGGFVMLLQFLRPRPFVVDIATLLSDYEMMAPRKQAPEGYTLSPELACDEVRQILVQQGEEPGAERPRTSGKVKVLIARWGTKA